MALTIALFFSRWNSKKMERYKEDTIKTYDQYSDQFDQKFEKHFYTFVQEKADAFIRELPGKDIVDLGCGPGNHARYFKERGLNVLGVDLSPAMVERTRSKGIPAEIHDIENLDLGDRTFDGVWMYASLLHVHRDRVSDVVSRVRAILKPNGLLGLAVKEGVGMQLESHPSYPGTHRLFTYFSDSEVRELFSPYFTLLHFGSTRVKDTYTFLHYLFKKKGK